MKRATEKILIVWSTVGLLAHPCRGALLILNGAKNSAALNLPEQINFGILIDTKKFVIASLSSAEIRLTRRVKRIDGPHSCDIPTPQKGLAGLSS